MPILNDTLFPSQKKGTILLHPRHIIRIDIFTITQCVLLTSPFNFKAVFFGNDSNLLIVFYVQIMPDDFVMQLHRF